jgi:hypothetical protein
LFCNVYIDESSQTQWRYLVLGGLVVPLSHAELFESDLRAARETTKIPLTRLDGTPRVMKWEKVNAYNFDAYKTVVDTTFNFRRLRIKRALKDMNLQCVVVDTSKKSLRDTGEGDVDVGFDKEFWFLCTVSLLKRYRRELFLLYPDRRHSRRPLREARDILNRGAYKYGDLRKFPFRRLRFDDPEQCLALQAVDIFIGALAYRLNGHYDKPNAKAAKRELCDYILRLCKIYDVFNTTRLYTRDFVGIIHRPQPANSPRGIPAHNKD